MRTTSFSSTSSPARVCVGCFDCGDGVAAGGGATRRGRWYVSSCAPTRAETASAAKTKRTRAAVVMNSFVLAGNFSTVLHSHQNFNVNIAANARGLQSDEDAHHRETGRTG